MGLTRTLTQTAASLAALLTAISSGASEPAKGDLEVGDGGTGPFYAWDSAIPTGTARILRREPFMPGKALVEAAVSDRVLYSSLGGFDGKQPIFVSGGVYLPKGKRPKGGWPVIAWAHGTVGFPDKCAPSFNGWSDRDTQYLNNWLKQGYAVVATDYEGLGTNGPHPYLMIRSEARGVLDSVLSARQPYGLSRRVVIVGQSQGAHAATGAALMQAEMAPSLDLKGVVLTGWVGQMRADPVKMDEYDPWSILILRFLPTHVAIDPGFRPASVLTPAGKARYESFRTTCGSDAMQKFIADKPISRSLFTVDPSSLEARALPYRVYPRLAFKAPVFLGIGEKDTQTSPRGAFEGAKSACALGTNITTKFYPGETHGSTVLRSQVDSISWVRAAFSGKVPPGGCEQLRFPWEQKG
ncbi:lipase family protein [Novosphingobium sp. MW5]|nr:lipase family protein [Novosphingobium sp. MW5]